VPAGQDTQLELSDEPDAAAKVPAAQLAQLVEAAGLAAYWPEGQAEQLDDAEAPVVER